MTKAELLTPYVEGAEPLTPAAVESHLANLPIAYYGRAPEGFASNLRHSHEPIQVIDDGPQQGLAEYSVLISGDLLTAKRILVKPMSWSDHPGRGFEALREALIADPSDELAVIGVSFPGAGLGSPGLTKKQAKSMSGRQPDMAYIGAQQWEAIGKALNFELYDKGLKSDESARKIDDYEFVISGSSQGASNAVGLLQAKPEHVNVVSLAVAEAVSFESRGRIRFVCDFLLHGSTHFKDYVAVNPFNQFPELGPGDNPAKGLARHPNSYLGDVVNTMRRGGNLDKILSALRQMELEDFYVTLAGASEDRLAKIESSQAATDKIKRAQGILKGGRFINAQTIKYDGHYHPFLENLANAQVVFRRLARAHAE